MFNKRSSRKGFTLPEVLVTVAIVAILAAVVVPAVTNQISKGETGQIASALNAYTTGVTTFVTDVRRYPGALSQLTNKIGTTGSFSKDVTNTTYSTGQVNSWKGPYTGQAAHVVMDSVAIGLGAFAVDSLRDTTLATGSKFVEMYIATSDTSVARQIDVMIDGGDGAAAGKVAWAEVTGVVTPRRVRVLLLPR